MPESQAPIHLGMFRVRLSDTAKRRLRIKFSTNPEIARIINTSMDWMTLEDFAKIHPTLKSCCIDLARPAAYVFVVTPE